MAKGGRFAAKKPNKKEKKSTGTFTKVLVTLGVILVLAVACVMGVTVYHNTLISMEANKPTVPTLPVETVSAEETEAVETEAVTEPVPTETTLPPFEASGKDIINILLIGDSAREGEESRLADTQILVTVNKVDKTLTMSSFLRDTYLKLSDYVTESGQKHTCGKGRINLAYHLGYKWGGVGGGMKLINDTLQNNFGVEVDHNVVVDFDIFMEVVNLVGGVRVHLDADEAAYLNKDLNKALGYPAYNYEATTDDKVSLDGMSALSFARMRHSNAGDSDIKRTARQRAVISGLIGAVKDLSFSDIEKLASKVLPMVTTDMTKEEIKTCMWEIIPLLPQLTISQQSIPLDGTYWSIELMMGEIMTYPLDFDAKKNREFLRSVAEADQLAVQSVG